MKEPKFMPHLIDVACLVVIGINLPFALYGYFLFGNSTEGIHVCVYSMNPCYIHVHL